MSENGLTRRTFIGNAVCISAAALYLPSRVSGFPAEQSGTSGGAESGSLPDKSHDALNPDEFRNPGTEYRGVALWFLNDDLKPDEAIRQLHLMRYAGWGRVILRRYSGLLDTPYDEVWNRILHRTLEECEFLKMKVFLQEGNVPFPDQKPEHGHKMLVRRPASSQPREQETLIAKAGNYAYYMHLDFQSIGSSTAFRKIDPLDADAMDAYLDALFGYLDKNFGYGFGRTIDAVWVDEPEVAGSARGFSAVVAEAP